jgi:hypothetical protein
VPLPPLPAFPGTWLSQQTKQFTDVVNGTLNGARGALVLSLTVMEAVINFLVDIYRSTFLCFLELIVRGTLSVLISAIQEVRSIIFRVSPFHVHLTLLSQISTFIQSTLSSLRTSIQNDIASVNSVLSRLLSNGINKINPFADITAPQFSVPSLDGLQNLTIPDSFTQALINLNSSIPSPAQIKDKLNAR